jgi:subtilisin family serine protease
MQRMTHIGVLRITGGESRLDDLLLAVEPGTPTPVAAATKLVEENGLRPGDRVEATGEIAVLDGQRALLVSTIGLAGEARVAGPATQRSRYDLAAAASLPAFVSPNLDPRLQWWIARQQAGDLRPATASTLMNEIAVVARVTEPEQWESLSEVRTPLLIGRTAGNEAIVTGRIPISRVEAVRSQPWVASLKAAQELVPQLHATVPEIAAQPGDLPDGHRTSGGAGVVVGIIDYGGDFMHENFRRPDGSTRLVTLWDQDAPSSASSPFGYGREHLPAAIDAALQQPNPYAALGYDPTDFDEDSNPGAHGTHVMDIAAGNGRGTSVAGVAPQADLIFVNISHAVDPQATAVVGKSFGDSVRLLEAAKYIFDRAGARPCVVNVSLGTNGGPHDGSTLVEEGLDVLVAAQPNRAVVVAAANAFADGIHAAGTVVAGAAVDLKWQVLALPRRDLELEVWYAGTDRFSLELLDPSGVVRVTVPPGQNETLVVGTKTVFVSNRLGDSNNGDNMIGVFLSRGIAPGTYTVRLRGDTVVDGRFHAWIERDDSLVSRFAPPHDNARTIGSVSCGHLSIAVGSYDAHKKALPISFFSSAGPTRDDRLKPEISAPGHHVRAALSGSVTGNCLMSGTSMAAPAVTGLVALMFEEAARRGGNLTVQQVRDILVASVRRGPPGDAGWHPQYGHGRVSAAAALEAVMQLFNTADAARPMRAAGRASAVPRRSRNRVGARPR